MRFIALNEGASSGFGDTECSAVTCSSAGTPTVTMPAIANHAKMMGTDSRTDRPRDERPSVAQLMVAHSEFGLQ